MFFFFHINQGIQRSRQVLNDSRKLLNVEPLPADLANAVMEVAAMASLSIPETPESWQIDLRPLSKMGRAHRKQWDAEARLNPSPVEG
jgi:hypothetical protein